MLDARLDDMKELEVYSLCTGECLKDFKGDKDDQIYDSERKAIWTLEYVCNSRDTKGREKALGVV